METKEPPTLLSIASPWPVVITLASYLPVGDLINLARTAIFLRAALHGFQPPSAADLQAEPRPKIRPFLCIGSHQTSYWKLLKQAAPFLCASPTHTRGSRPRPCRFCSTPICEACIVKDSFAKRTENTFKNRCRFLCKDCWIHGNPHRRYRFTGEEFSDSNGVFRYQFAPGHGQFCGCTNKDDGWVCISCKDMQNAEANKNGFELCFGEGCCVTLEEDKDRRRICLWCDRPMLRGRASMESRSAFDQKMQDVRARRDLDFDGRARKQQKLYKMSRREVRGDEAVARDPLADAPQFVRHLDTINYQRYMPWERTPSGEQVYQSKLGRWVYNREFLLAVGRCCKKLPKRSDVTGLTRRDGEQLERINLLEESDVRSWRFEKYKKRDIAEGVEFEHLRRSSCVSAEERSAQLGQSEIHGRDPSEEMDDDQAFALALQAEFDEEMTEALKAEFIADTAEEADLTQPESDSEASESDEECSIRSFYSANSVVKASTCVQDQRHALHSQDCVATTLRNQAQLNTPHFETSSDLGESSHPNAVTSTDNLLASKNALDSKAGGDQLRECTLSSLRPQGHADRSADEANGRHDLGQIPAQLAQNDLSLSYAR